MLAREEDVEAHALREQALILALTGSGARADGLLERSAAEAERQGAAYELALTRRAQARLALEHGREDARDDMRRAEETLRGLLGESALDPRAPAALSLADRFDAVLSNGRRIASALDPGAVHDAVREAASALLREESRGAHWRDDHEGRRPGWQGHLEVRADPAAGLVHHYVPTEQEQP